MWLAVIGAAAGIEILLQGGWWVWNRRSHRQELDEEAPQDPDPSVVLEEETALLERLWLRCVAHYRDERCLLRHGHPGFHQGESAAWVGPSLGSRCKSTHQGQMCVLSEGHPGAHTTGGAQAYTWEKVCLDSSKRCLSFSSGEQCVLEEDHDGLHTTGGFQARTWKNECGMKTNQWGPSCRREKGHDGDHLDYLGRGFRIKPKENPS